MAQNPGALKRQKELARLEWQAEKAAKRKQRAAQKREQGTQVSKSDGLPSKH